MSGYPDVPGYRSGPNEATSREAATEAAKRSTSLKARIYAMVSDCPSTPEELVSAFAARGERVLLNTTRARCTDLHMLGKFKPSGTYGRGESGKVRVIRWRVATPDEQSLFAARRALEGDE